MKIYSVGPSQNFFSSIRGGEHPEPNLLKLFPPGNGPHFREFIIHVRWHFDKGATSNIDVILHDHVEVPHVPPLAVHLVMVLRMVSKVPSVAHKSKSHY